MKVIGGMAFGHGKKIGSMADKSNELKIGEMASSQMKDDKKALQNNADLAKLMKN